MSKIDIDFRDDLHAAILEAFNATTAKKR